MFKVGDMVKWESQSGGYWKAKAGVITEVVPIGKRPLNGDVGIGALPRIHESYVVRVDDPKGKKKPSFYWPVVSKLVKIT